MDQNDNHQINLQGGNDQSQNNSSSPPLIDYMDKPKNKNNMIFGGILGIASLLVIGIVGYYIYNYFTSTPKNIFSDENISTSNTPAEIDIIPEPEQIAPEEELPIWSAFNSAKEDKPKPSYLNPKAEDYDGIITGSEANTQVQKPTTTDVSTPTEPKGKPSNVIVNKSIIWTPNDYKFGDIKGSTHSVIWGDTLWEISEGKYGKGSQWKKIESKNKIEYLRNGNPLITPGQNLQLPE